MSGISITKCHEDVNENPKEIPKENPKGPHLE
jgi:hypothetical protein